MRASGAYRSDSGVSATTSLRGLATCKHATRRSLQAGTSFFVNAAAASSSAQLAGNEPLPDIVGELLFLEFIIFLESQAHVHLRRGTEGKGEGNWKQLNATVSVAS